MTICREELTSSKNLPLLQIIAFRQFPIFTKINFISKFIETQKRTRNTTGDVTKGKSVESRFQSPYQCSTKGEIFAFVRNRILRSKIFGFGRRQMNFKPEQELNKAFQMGLSTLGIDF